MMYLSNKEKTRLKLTQGLKVMIRRFTQVFRTFQRFNLKLRETSEMKHDGDETPRVKLMKLFISGGDERGRLI